MARYSNTLRDSRTEAPIEGAWVLVQASDTGAAATLADDNGDPLDNPFKTDRYGSVVFNAADGAYDLTYIYGGRDILIDRNVGVGAGAVLPIGFIVNSLGNSTVVAPSQKVVTDSFNALYANSGSSLVGFLQSGTGAVARTVKAKMTEIVTVTDYGADPTGGVDSRAAFNAASTAVGSGGKIIVPRGRYLINDVVDILDGQTWLFDGSTLFHTDDTKTILRSDSKTGWSIEGNVILEGLLTTASDTGECGLRITDGKRYRVNGVTAKLFKGKGIWLDGSDAGMYRGDRGQFTDCAAHESMVGVQIDPGAGAEYNTWVNFCASGNIVALQEGAGNNIFLGGNIVDNTTGIKLVNGPNHAHGMFVGVNINHNNSENIHAIGILNGHSFVGCHIYGNGTTTGAIWLEGCAGIAITAGIVDCYIYNDSGTGSGANYVTNNYLPLDYGVNLVSNNGALGQLYVSGNWSESGPWEKNDPSAIYVEASRGGSSQNIAAGATPLVFNNEIKDNRSAYDATTGIFTAPVAGSYELEVTVCVGAASGLGTSYLAIVQNNSFDLGYVPVVALSATLGVASGGLVATLNAGDTITVKSTITGTTPELKANQSRLSISLVE